MCAPSATRLRWCGSRATGSLARNAIVAAMSSSRVVKFITHMRIANRPRRRVDEMKAIPERSSAAINALVHRVRLVLVGGVGESAGGSRRRPAGRARRPRACRSPRSGVPRGAPGRSTGRSRVRNAASPNVRTESPDLQRVARPRQLHPEVGEVDLLLVRDRVEQVLGRDLERAPQQGAVADEKAAALVRLVEPLVRIDRDRVRQLDPGERLASALGQRREATVRSIDVQPGTGGAADLGDLRQRIDRPGARAATADGDEERPQPGGSIGLDRSAERRSDRA